MLVRPENLTGQFRCIECGLSSQSPAFHFHYGLVENGPAYFCDRGVLCSAACSLAHYKKREAEGTVPTKPADDIYS